MGRRAEATGRAGARRPPALALGLAAALQTVVVAALVAQAAGTLRSAPLAGLRAEVAALIVQGVEGGSLPLAVTASVERATTGDDGLLTLPLSFEVPGAALLGAAPPGGETAAETTAVESAGELELELYVYALDGAGAVAGHRAERLTLDLSRVGERLFDTGLRYRDAIRLPAGTYSLRFLALDPVRRVFGLALREVTLGRRGGAPVFAAPRLTGGCDTWLEAGSSLAGGAPRASARPVLRAGRTAPAVFELLPAATPPPAVDTLRVVFERLPSVAAASTPRPAAELVVPASAGEAGFELDLKPPADLPRGRYSLWVEARAGDGAVLSSSPAEVWVLGADASQAADACFPTWGEVYRLALGGEPASDGPPAAAEVVGPAERGAGELRFRRRYLELLGELTAGRSLASAGARLGEIEAEFLSRRLDTFARLRAVELAVGRELTAGERRCLPILLALHEQAYEEHFAAGRYGLATHSRELVVRLVDELVAAATDDEARVAALVLTSLGDRAESHQVSGAAQEMLERALELDPDNREARFLLATSYERVGRETAARRHLERLVAASAGHVEGRLRLAVLLAKDGRWAESERLLRRLLAEGLGGWRRTVAYQTLGRSLLSRERFDEAVDLLRQARAERPDEQRLTLLGAYALDRAGRPSEAEAWLAELPAASADGSARLRYGRPASAGVGGDGDGALGPPRELVARSLAVRLPILARALGEIEKAEG